MQIKIGIDIDGVITDESHENDNIWHHRLCSYLGYPIKRQKNSYNFIEAYNLEPKIIEDFLQENLAKIYAHLPPLPAAVQRIQQWFQTGNKIILITARDPKFNSLTQHWLKSHQIPYHELHHAKEKAPLAAQKGIQLFIEDYLNNALDLIQKDIPVILINKYHNQEQNIKDQRLFRANNWQEVAAIARQLFAI